MSLSNEVRPPLCAGTTVLDSTVRLLRSRLSVHGGAINTSVHGAGNATMLLTISTSAVACMFDSFVSHIETALATRSVVFLVNVALDTASIRQCQQRQCSGVSPACSTRLRLACVDLRLWWPAALRQQAEARPTSNSGYQSCEYHLVTMIKPIILLHTVQARMAAGDGSAVLFLDLDLVLRGDLVRWLRTKVPRTASLVLGRATPTWRPELPEPRPNTNVILATARSVPLLAKWAERCASAVSQQGFEGDMEELYAMWHTIRPLRLPSPTHHVLNANLRGDDLGALFDRIQMIGGDVIAECGNSSHEASPLATHYDCIWDKPNTAIGGKVARMWRQGDWRPRAQSCMVTNAQVV